MSEKEYEKAKYVFPVHGVNWTGGIGQPTGIYWLDGDSVFAVHGSLAEELVIERGGILIATLRFDRDPFGDAQRDGRSILRVAPEALVSYSASSR